MRSYLLRKREVPNFHLGGTSVALSAWIDQILPTVFKGKADVPLD